MEAVWIHKLVSRLFDQVLDSTVIYCDNQSCVKLTENLEFHDKSKHIEIVKLFEPSNMITKHNRLFLENLILLQK